MPMEHEISYRQVGREKGYVPPPRLKEASGKPQQSNKRDAFGTRTQRFGTITNDIPPPGAYYRRPTFERDSKTCGSVSAKGYGGGFVSTAPRFRDVKALQEAHLPGPGSYMGQSESRSDGIKLASFSSLKRDIGFSANPEHTVPGPGQYNLDRKERYHLASGPTASFRCARKPLEAGFTMDTPGPGAYRLERSEQAKIDKKGQVLQDPFFRSQTKRVASFIPGGDVPGPGEYDIGRGLAVSKDPQPASAVYGHSGKGMETGAGMRGGDSRRLGDGGPSKEDAFVSPGPGWYTPHQTKAVEKTPSSSSMFRSATKRFAAGAVAAAPGPAFYQPEPLGKKSFRWNANKQWV